MDHNRRFEIFDERVKESWICAFCTYHNNMLIPYCETCGGDKPEKPEIYVDINGIFDNVSMNVSINSMEEKKSNPDNSSLSASVDRSASQLRKFAPRPISCNGDCGSQFAKLIHNLIHEDVKCFFFFLEYMCSFVGV